MTLDQLKKNQKAVIQNVNTDAVPQKLIDMGFLSGNYIELRQIAPLGDPLYFLINDTHISIRRELAKEIIVEII